MTALFSLTTFLQFFPSIFATIIIMGIVFFNNQTFGLISPTGVIFAAVRQNVATFYLAQSCSVTKTLQQKVSRISHGPHAETQVT